MTWDKELAALKISARASGGEAFKDGLPCEAPSYGRGDVEACWRLGWKVEAGKAGMWPIGALSGGGSTPWRGYGGRQAEAGNGRVGSGDPAQICSAAELPAPTESAL